MGLSNAVELITSGEPIDAQTAASMGLVDDVSADEFAVLYADQNQRDYEEFLRAIVEGRIPRSDIADPKTDRRA